jgi:hypothetical protein
MIYYNLFLMSRHLNSRDKYLPLKTSFYNLVKLLKCLIQTFVLDSTILVSLLF